MLWTLSLLCVQVIVLLPGMSLQSKTTPPPTTPLPNTPLPNTPLPNNNTVDPFVYIIGIPIPSNYYEERENFSQFSAFILMTSRSFSPITVDIVVMESISEASSYSDQLSIGKEITFRIPSFDDLLLSPMEKTKKGVVITTSEEIEVAVFVAQMEHRDYLGSSRLIVTSLAYMKVLSTHQLGYLYTLPVQEKMSVSNHYSLVIISTTAKNKASINLQTAILEMKEIPWITFQGVILKELNTLEVHLEQYEAFLLQSIFSMKASRISFSHPAAVFFGQQNKNDLLINQVLPVSSAMTEYVQHNMDLPKNIEGYARNHIVTVNDDTPILVIRDTFLPTGKTICLERAGDYWVFNAHPATHLLSTSDKPFVATFYKYIKTPIKKLGCASPLIPKAFWRNEYIWSLPQVIPGEAELSELMINYLTVELCIVIETDLRFNLKLDGSKLPFITREKINGNFTQIEFTVPGGRHTISLKSTGDPSQTFTAYLFGHLTNPDNSTVFFCHALGLIEDTRKYLYKNVDPFPNKDNKRHIGFEELICDANTTTTPASIATSTDEKTVANPVTTTFSLTSDHNPTELPTIITTGRSSTEIRQSISTRPSESESTNTTDDLSVQKELFICSNSSMAITSSNISDAQLEKLLIMIRRHLTVNKRQTSMAIRRLISSPDSRWSSAGIAIMGMSVCTIIATVVVWSDMARFGRCPRLKSFLNKCVPA